MLGNDIVDLEDADARPESFRARFDERVFSLEERTAIAHDANPLARRWAHWGAKEAAFKLAKQVDPEFVFSPSRLVAVYAGDSSTSEKTANARHADLARASNRLGSDFVRRGRLELPASKEASGDMLEVRSFETSERVHVIVVPESTDWEAIDFAVERLDPSASDPSAAVRRLAIRGMSRSLGIATDRITIGRAARIPNVELDGKRTSLCLSLSHHGRWIGYAMSLCSDSHGRTGWRGGWMQSARERIGPAWRP